MYKILCKIYCVYSIVLPPMCDLSLLIRSLLKVVTLVPKIEERLRVELVWPYQNPYRTGILSHGLTLQVA